MSFDISAVALSVQAMQQIRSCRIWAVSGELALKAILALLSSRGRLEDDAVPRYIDAAADFEAHRRGVLMSLRGWARRRLGDHLDRLRLLGWLHLGFKGLGCRV